MACDICGKVGTELVPLRDEYQTNDIKALCPECRKLADTKLMDIRIMTAKMNGSLLKRFLGVLKGSFSKTTDQGDRHE